MIEYSRVPIVTISKGLILETPQVEFYINADFEIASGWLPEMLPLSLVMISESADRECCVELEDCFPADAIPDLSISRAEFTMQVRVDIQAILHRAICNALSTQARLSVRPRGHDEIVFEIDISPRFVTQGRCLVADTKDLICETL
jgi:hypothetical protein